MSSLRIVLGWGLIGTALFLALSFSTWRIEPPELLGTRLANLGGPLGKEASGLLAGSFGVGAYMLAFYLVFLGYILLGKRTSSPHALMLVGLFVAMLTFGGFCQALLPGHNFPGGSAPLGGVLGFEIDARLQSLFGRMWTLVTLGVGALASSILATDHLLSDLLHGRPATKSRRGSKTTSKEPGLRSMLGRRLAAVLGPEADPTEEEVASAEADLAALSTEMAQKPKSRRRRKSESPEDGAELEPALEASDEAPDALEEPRKAPPIRDNSTRTTTPSRKRGKQSVEAESQDVDEAAIDELETDSALEELNPELALADELAEAASPVALDENEAEASVEEAGADEDLVPAQANPPKIRQAAAPVLADGIEVIRLSRDPKLRGKEKYELPAVKLLQEPVYLEQRESDEEIQAKAAALELALLDFGVTAKVEEIVRGPVITRFDISIARGTKISKVTSLADELAMAMGVARVRIAPVKGKPVLGAEIPNRERETVFLRELILATDLRKGKIVIPLFLGKDAAGQPIIEDLATTPHLLIAGRTGAGKSVFVNNLILSILFTRYPEEVRLIMIDPKKVELEVYQDIPHLLTKVESSPKKATKILEWAVNHMEERYELLAATGVRHVSSYNKLPKAQRLEKLVKVMTPDEAEKQPDHLPYIVIIVDELADLMMVAGKDVEQAIARLAQKARAVGIHVVLATQRPSIDVITGLIKSNLPARIAFQTRTGIDSRTILDRYGAEKLLDKGDMLYLSATSDDPKRIQGPFVSDAEVERAVEYLREKATPQYTHHFEQVGSPTPEGAAGSERDELFDQAVELVISSGQASASYLQTRMQVGYARARRLIDLMGEAGIVSEHRGSKAREILITPEQWEEMRQKAAQTSSS